MRLLDRITRPALAAAIAALALGTVAQPAAAAPQPGQKFGDWTVGCEQAEGGQLCNISQIVHNPQAKQSVLVAIARPAQGEPQFLVRVPLGVILTQGIGVQVDDGKGVRLPFVQCMPNGCQTIVPMEADTIAKMKNGNTLSIVFAAPGGQAVNAPLSLKGFTAAFDSLK